METPDQRVFEEDILSAAFRAGVFKGSWDVAAADLLPAALAWPTRMFFFSEFGRA